MQNPERQGQHRVPQTYLKQFGYHKDDQWWISVLRKETNKTSNVLIKNFTVETNVYDLPYEDFKDRRHFENTSGIIENKYNKIISNIHNQQQITKKDKDLLNHLVASFLGRTGNFRSFIEDVLHFSRRSRERFIQEICVFTGKEIETQNTLGSLDKMHQLNFAICLVVNHLVKVLRNFQQVIIKACDDKFWFTSDSPVCLNKQGRTDMLIPLEAEIFLPLSRDYCVFMYHDDSEMKTNSLLNLRIAKVNSIDNNIFHSLVHQINLNSNYYLIFPIYIADTIMPLIET